jgi:hypothetical protein
VNNIQFEVIKHTVKGKGGAEYKEAGVHAKHEGLLGLEGGDNDSEEVGETFIKGGVDLCGQL